MRGERCPRADPLRAEAPRAESADFPVLPAPGGAFRVSCGSRLRRKGRHRLRKEDRLSPDPSENIVTTESGLQYVDLVEGTGESPARGANVRVHYTGWLTSGEKFDSSLDRGQPFTFPLGMGRVIRGWDEGVASMKVGGKRKLIIPSELGYGQRGAGGVIPPGATLVFEVELLAVS